MAKLCPVMDPDFNREKICKEMLLLEDHLMKPCERCRDCIRKHLLKIDGLADEMGSLDATGQYTELASALAKAARNWLAEIEKLDFDHASATRSLQAIGQRVRRCRKKLVKATFRRKKMSEHQEATEEAPSLEGNSLEEQVESLTADAENAAISNGEFEAGIRPKWQERLERAPEYMKNMWKDAPSSYRTIAGTAAALLAGSFLFR